MQFCENSVLTCSMDSVYINQILTSRQEHFFAIKTNKFKVGVNCLANRFYLLNGTIPLQWLNNSIDTFKVKMWKTIAGLVCEKHISWFQNPNLDKGALFLLLIICIPISYFKWLPCVFNNLRLNNNFSVIFIRSSWIGQISIPQSLPRQ